MERSAIIIVCNGQPFIKLQLEHIYNIVDEIIVVEGPDKFYQKIIKSKRSNDGTIKIIKTFPDPDNKIKLIHTNCNKNQMVAEGNKLCNGEFIYQVDVDEFLPHSVIDTAFKKLKTTNANTILVPERWYYKWYDTYMAANRPNNIRALPGRFFKNRIDKNLYISHIPWHSYQKNGKHIGAKTKRLEFTNFGHHFLAIYKWQIIFKIKYYSLRGNKPKHILKRKIIDFDNYERSDIAGGLHIKSYKSHLILGGLPQIDIINENIEFLTNFELCNKLKFIANKIETETKNNGGRK
ncbi:MAG: glycosyltransferase [Atribacterota bacterium]